MLKNDAREVVSRMSDLVEDRSRKFIFVFLKAYQENPTKKKLYYLIMNLPLGLIINNTDVEKLLKNGKAPTYEKLVSFLTNNEKIKELIRVAYDK